MPSQLLQGFRAGPWQVEPLRGAITDPDGESHHLEPKVMDVFVCLAENVNELVTRDQLLEAVWGRNAVSDEPLTRAIGELRRAFQNGTGDSIHIETIPKRGYRLIGEVALVDGSTDNLANTIQFPGSHRMVHSGEGQFAEEAEPVQTNVRIGKRKIGLAVIGTLSLVVIIFSVYGSRGHGPSPHTEGFNNPVVTAYKKLTQSQIVPLPVSSPFPIVADNSRLYFPVYVDGRYGTKQVARSGGAAVDFQNPLNDSDSVAVPSTLIADKSSIVFDVIDNLKSGNFTTELWTLPVVGGSPMRMGEGMNGVFSPSGAQLLYVKNHRDLYIANVDMTDESKIVVGTGMTTHWPRFSPDGARVRFTVFTDHYVGSQWELNLGDHEPEPMLVRWPAQSTCCGSWTPDGAYFVFEAQRDNGTQLWALKNSADGSADSAEPFPITSGIINFSRPTISADGKTIFAFGWQLRGEIVEYDSDDGAFKPIPGLEMMSAEYLAYSTDKQRVSYVSYPNHSLWQKSLDGSGAVQLTSGSMRVANPTWSPDGNLIAFKGWEPGGISRIYTIPVDGGQITLISEAKKFSWSPSWSPDGSKLAYSQAGGERITTFDFELGTAVELPGSEGIHSPSWSPNGRFIVGRIKQDFILYDVENETWELMLNGNRFESGSWSEDSKSFFLVETFMMMRERSVFRLNIDDKSLTKIAQVGHERDTWGVQNRWVGVTPDGKPMLLRDHSIHNIYALEWNRD